MSQSDQTNPLRTVAEVATIANYYQINSIKDKIREIEQTVNQSAENEQRQNNIKQVIFQINNFITKESDGIKDKLVVATALVAIKRILSKSNLNSASFVQISDKQYFQETITLLNSKIIEVQSYEHEATTIENDYRHFIAFSKIAEKSSSIIKLIERRDNGIRNAVIAFIIGFILLYWFAKTNTNTYDTESPDLIGIIIFGSIVGGFFAAFPLLIRKSAIEMLQDSLLTVIPYINMADIKIDADNLMHILNTSSQNAEKIKINIVEYEKMHPDLELIKKLL